MFSQLVKQMAEAEGITEQPKAEDQMMWVQRMSDICERAAETMLNELIYS